MAKVPLRVYIREIENLVERGQIEEGVAHCKTILRQFPKNIETYRLLGKAYLESQRYSEAADILQRVLSVYPDDFVAQLGMSIVREDENNLDAAIWHMERAYEVQPFNRAIQDELRRLYGRRDGVEPPKIRLTRGALVRMYARGQLYQQAIAETRAALAEDPQRIDLETLLARMYFNSGQKLEATEVSSNLINRLPFCYEANSILAQILPETSRADDARVFQQRLVALDAYAAFLSPSAPSSDRVADQAVMAERIDWTPGAEDVSAPDWARNIGVTWEEEKKEEELPDWLSTLNAEAAGAVATAPVAPPPSAEQITPAVEAEAEEDLIPDWMKTAGWKPGAEEQPSQEIATDEEPLATAQMPAWVQAMQPSATPEGSSEEAEKLAFLESILPAAGVAPTAEVAPAEEAAPDWLAGLAEESPAAEAAPAEAAAPEWLAGLAEESPTAEAAPATPAEEAAPEWLAGMAEEPSTAEAAPAEAAAPEWLAGLAEEPPVAEAAPVTPAEAAAPEWLAGQAEETPAAEAAPAEAAAPDWLAGLAEESPTAEAVPPAPAEEAAPEWLAGLAEEPPAAESTPTMPAEAAVPDWLAGLAEEPPAAEAVPAAPAEAAAPEWLAGLAEEPPAVEAVPAAPAEEAAPDWLAGLAEEPPVAEAVPAASTEEATPDWLAGLAEESPTAEAVPPAPAEEAAPERLAGLAEEPLTGPKAETTLAETPPEDLDAAMAWLEGLAARQGAEEGTLGVTASEEMPDWLKTQAEAELPAITPPTALAEIPEPAAAEPPSSVFELTQEDQISLPQAESISEPQAEATAVSEPAVSEGEAAPVDDMDAAMAWLEGLAARQGAEEGTLGVAASEEMPDWLKAQAAAESPSAAFAEIPEPAAAEPPSSVFELTQEEQISLPQGEAISESQAEATAVSEPAVSEGEAAPVDDMDAAMAWMEALAARQGADAETLTISSPSTRSEEVPEWVHAEMVKEDSDLAESQPVSVEGIGTVAAVPEAFPQTTAVEWPPEPASTDAPTQPIRAPAAQTPDEPEEEYDIPEWLKGYEEEVRAQPPVWKPEDLDTNLRTDTGMLPSWLMDETAPSAAQTAQAEDILMPAESPAVPLQQTESPAVNVPNNETVSAPSGVPEIDLARSAIRQGNIQSAIDLYAQLTVDNRATETVIQDLREALYRYPLDVNLWQALGDAYIHANRIQDALDAYTKAEELLR